MSYPRDRPARLHALSFTVLVLLFYQPQRVYAYNSSYPKIIIEGIVIETRAVLGKEVNIILPLKVMSNETDPVTLYGKGLTPLRTIHVAGPALKKDVNYR